MWINFFFGLIIVIKKCRTNIAVIDFAKDSRREKNIRFIQFPQPDLKPLMSRHWAKLCGQKGFDHSQITRNIFICESLHVRIV